MQNMNRKLLKDNAKIALKRNFWMIMLVVFLGGILQVNWSGISNGNASAILNVPKIFSSVGDNEFSSVINKVEEDLASENIHSLSDYIDSAAAALNISSDKFVQVFFFGIAIFLIVYLLITVIIFCVSFLFGSFISAPVAVGYNRFFMRNRHNIAKFDDEFFAFKKNKYMPIVKTMFFTNIRIWGWSLLFYFPGLVKLYEYYFVTFIMAENPSITPERAREISTKMTDGYKWKMFVLDLSFLGWIFLFILAEILLSIFSCGILAIPGAVLLYPISGYISATMAELYAERREFAIISGIASKEELVGFLD